MKLSVKAILAGALIISASLIAAFYVFLFTIGLDVMPALLLTLLTVFIIAAIVISYIYSRANARTLEIYRNIIKLRNLKEKEFPNGSRLLEEEINKILKEWSSESREEIDHLKQVEIYRKEFLSNVSHELKTPIFSIQGYVHTLIDGGIEDHDVNMLYLNKASRSIDRLISIVDDLESISKMEAGELLVEPRTFDIVDLAKDVIESLDLQTKERNVKLFTVDEKPLYVYADKDLIRQVIVNLLVNSIKYGKRDGQTEVRFSDRGENVMVEVVDNGIGIEKYHLPRLFERFYRVDKSRSREQGGTGLGLAIVKHIIEAHQQTIVVESTVDKGTTFSFTLKKSK